MNAYGDAIATLFTVFTFILIIVLPVVMSFVQAKRDRKADTSQADNSASKKRGSSAKNSGGLFSSIALLRKQDRESEPKVSFSEGTSRDQGRARGSGGDTPRAKAFKQRPASEQHTTQQLGAKFDPIEKMKHSYGKSLSQVSEISGSSAGREKQAALPNSIPVSRLRELNELQRAILLSEILGPPKGL